MAKVAFVSIMWHSRFVEELGVEYLTAVFMKLGFFISFQKTIITISFNR